jgi:hypothetical protein
MRSTLAGVPSRSRSPWLLAVALLALAAACGKGGTGGSSGGASPLPPSSSLAARCVTPRVGNDPQTSLPYPDRAGTLADEKGWVRSWIDELYLWYAEVPNPDPVPFPTAVTYFNVLKTSATTASGAKKDRFHFSYPTDVWVALSQSGIEAGYGAQWVLISASPPRQVVAAYVEPGSPADAANIVRGTEVLTVDGVDLINGSNTAALNGGLFPAAVNELHYFTVLDPGAVTGRYVPLTSAAITSTPVPAPRVFTTATGPVGYILFNDHILTAEAQLVAAVQQLKTAGVTDLVLDLRYNGGGYLAIAAQVAYMIAGPTRTSNKVFERLTFNDKAGTLDPINGGPNLPYGFVTTGLGWPGTLPATTPLPYLGSDGLGTIYVLTGPGTCSASESIINSLRGIGVTVVQVGATTCGKPYGFYPEDNCGTTYFAIQFQGVNAAGFGDYGDGFVPAGTGTNGLPGCVVADDYGHQLGDPAEGRLAAALYHRANAGACPPSPAPSLLRAQRPTAGEGELIKSPMRQLRILTRP